MAKSSLISTTNQQTPNSTSTLKAISLYCIKSILYTLARRIHTIITDKNLQKTRLKELHTALNQRGYPPTTLINKGFELVEKIPQRELKNPKKQNNEEPQAYFATYYKNNPELFAEIIKKHRRT